MTNPGQANLDARPVIVVGVDGSESSKDAVRWAARQAELTGAVLHAVIAWQHPPIFGLEPPAGLEWDFATDARNTLQQALDAALGPKPSVEVHTSAVEGRPAPVLLEAAKAAELLVVGRRGQGAFPRMTLGSVAVHCVNHSPCPVVVVRHGQD